MLGQLSPIRAILKELLGWSGVLMHSSLAQVSIIQMDLVMTIALFAIFLQSGLRKNYPWMFAYLGLRSLTAVMVEFLLYGPLLASAATYYKIYFLTHWISYVVSAALLFMVCLDIYRQAMAPLPGLARMGTTVFRWAMLASILVTATSLTSLTWNPHILVQIGTQLMRCVGTVQLCLLALLALSMNAIGLSVRSRPFGIALGFGVIAANDCAESFMGSYSVQLNSPVQSVFEGVTVAALALWTVYAVLPEKARKPVTVAAGSTIYRWDQIASALGHKGTQVAPQPAPSFFLVDVEKLVERAFSRTLKGKESQS
jgi:hypothetical protein